MSKTFEVQPNRKYLILEKADDGAPPELKKIGRSKRGGGFSEFAGCPYDESTNKYNTGLDRYSREFHGKDTKYIERVLKERAPLIEYYKQILGEQDETEFLADYKLELKHNQQVDTGNPDQYLKLFLVMRGVRVTPEGEEGNIGKYGSSMYVLIDNQEKQDLKTRAIEMKYEAIEWLQKRLKNRKKDAIAYLQYENIIPLGQTAKSNALIQQAFDQKMEDYNALVSFLKTIEEVSVEKVHLTISVRLAIRNNRIQKEGNSFFFNGTELGHDLRSVVAFLGRGENAELVEAIVS